MEGAPLQGGTISQPVPHLRRLIGAGVPIVANQVHAVLVRVKVGV